MGVRWRAVGLFVVTPVAACGSSPASLGHPPVDTDASPSIVCGPGTWLSDHQCLPLPQDAAGGASRAADASVVCGNGTSLAGNVCVANFPEASVPPEVGTGAETGVPVESGAPGESGTDSGATLHCGAGTYDDAGACIPSQ